MNYYVYMTSSKPYGTIYTGMTNNLSRRIWEHKNHVAKGFTDEYQVHRLVWFEQHSTAENAIKREKRLKRFKRDWKIELIEADNPNWDDMFNAVASG